jgi:hypothetical protein
VLQRGQGAGGDELPMAEHDDLVGKVFHLGTG